MKNCQFLKVLILLSTPIWCLTRAHAFEIKGMKFTQQGETSKITFEFDKPGVKAKKFHVPDDKQIIVDLTDVDGKEKVIRPMDTSEFSGSVILVTPYKKPGETKDLRVAIQLRDNVRSLLEAVDDKLVLTVENRFGVFNKTKIDQGKKEESKVVEGDGTIKINVPRSDSVEDILTNLTLSGTKRYVGKKISFNVKDIAIVEILKMIADASGFNIILSEEVKKAPNVTLSLTGIPWDQALDTILDLGKLVAAKNGNILMITTLEMATKEKLSQLQAEELNVKEIPLVTKIFPLSFAKTEELSKILNEYLTPGRGKISIDTRTDSLIIKDTPDTIERIKKIVETLDTQTPQIQIEAKIVEMSEGYAKDIGLGNGWGVGYDPIHAPITANSSNAIKPNYSFNSAAGVGSIGSGSVFTTVIRSLAAGWNINFDLRLMESEKKGKVISSPKVITQNGQKAQLKSDYDLPYAVTITDSNGNVTKGYEKITQTLLLDVEPHVTNEGSINMNIQVKKDSLGTKGFLTSGGPSDLYKRSLTTNVLVENGSTVVIGGIYGYTSDESISGIPFLKDLPILGWLFRSSYKPTVDKQELVIFVTPRIVNIEEAGLVNRENETE